MLGNIGPLEIIVVLIIALVVFGPKRLPELGNSLGRGIREFRDTVSGEHKPDDAAVKEIERPTPVPPSVAPADKSAEHEVVSDKRS